MRVHLINPSEVSFGTAVITPRWLVCPGRRDASAALAIPVWSMKLWNALDPLRIQPGDIVGIGIHTANALRGYAIGKMARERGAHVVFGGIHATLYPSEAHELGGAHAVVKGDGDVVWGRVLADCARGTPLPVYEGGRIEASDFLPGTLGSGAAEELHVGFGTDGSRLSQALFFLLGLADRRAAPATTRLGCGD